MTNLISSFRTGCQVHAQNHIQLKDETHAKDKNIITELYSQLMQLQQNNETAEAKVHQLTMELMSTKAIVEKTQKVETSLLTLTQELPIAMKGVEF